MTEYIVVSVVLLVLCCWAAKATNSWFAAGGCALGLSVGAAIAALAFFVYSRLEACGWYSPGCDPRLVAPWTNDGLYGSLIATAVLFFGASSCLFMGWHAEPSILPECEEARRCNLG
jgi:hypothetical protein